MTICFFLVHMPFLPLIKNWFLHPRRWVAGLSLTCFWGAVGEEMAERQGEVDLKMDWDKVSGSGM